MEELTEKQLYILSGMRDGKVLSYLNGIPGITNPEVFLSKNTKVSLKDFEALRATKYLAYKEGQIGLYKDYVLSPEGVAFVGSLK